MMWTLFWSPTICKYVNDKKYNKQNIHLVWTIEKNGNLLTMGFTSSPNLESSSICFFNILCLSKNPFLQVLIMNQYFLLSIYVIPEHTFSFKVFWENRVKWYFF